MVLKTKAVNNILEKVRNITLTKKNTFSIVPEYLCLHFPEKKELANFL